MNEGTCIHVDVPVYDEIEPESGRDAKNIAPWAFAVVQIREIAGRARVGWCEELMHGVSVGEFCPGHREDSAHEFAQTCWTV